ncbi:hypothetical protein J6590_075418 [Homalodisca vitripennis]|nr:hypothetical protein J6590_075418 [Homalodisca vitripennis]
MSDRPPPTVHSVVTEHSAAVEVSRNQSAVPSEVTIQSVTTQSEDSVKLATIPSRHTITQSKPYTMVTPEEVAPFPKAPLRKKGNRGRKPGRTVLEPRRAKKVANDKAHSKKKKKAIANKILFDTSSGDYYEYPDSGSEDTCYAGLLEEVNEGL